MSRKTKTARETVGRHREESLPRKAGPSSISTRRETQDLCEPETDYMRQQTLTLHDLSLPTGSRTVGGGIETTDLHPIRI